MITTYGKIASTNTLLLNKRLIKTLTINGLNKISEFKPVDPFYTFGILKNTDNKYYFAAMGKGGATVKRNPYIFKYNAVSNNIEQEVLVNVSSGHTSVFDTHRCPVITNDEDGNIYLIAEKLTNGSTGNSDGHNTDMLIYKTSTPYDLTTLTLVNTIIGKWSYPNIWVKGNIVYAGARGNNTTQVVGEWRIFKSLDGGLTFDNGSYVYNSQTTTRRAYINQLYNAYNDDLYIVLNERDDTSANWTFVSVFKSSDGATWTNVSGSFSKSVGTSNPITRAEALASCKIIESSNYSSIGYTFEGGIVKPDGSICLIIAKQTLTGVLVEGNQESNLDEIRYYNWNPGLNVWSYNSIDVVGVSYPYFSAYNKTVYYGNDTGKDVVYFVDFQNNNSLKRLTSSNKFESFNTKLLLTGNGSQYMGGISANTIQQDEHLIILNDPQGDLFDFNSYSDIILVSQ